MKKILSIGLVLMISASAWAAHSVDGVISTGEWSVIVNDPTDNNSWNLEMSSWGAEVEGDYLYWFCELSSTVANPQQWSDFQGGSKMVFPGLWMDVDASTSTYLKDGGDVNCADHSKLEWAANHRGIDLNVELGLIGDWVNGSLTGPSGEGAGEAGAKSMYNGWGNAGDVGTVIADPITDGASWYVNGYVMEARISLTELAGLVTAAYGLPNATAGTIGDYLMVAVGVQGDNGTVTWGYDVGTPHPIAVDGSAVLDGDANLDGDVNAADYTIWADNYSGNIGWRGGDFNMDNVIDAADYTMWADSYGDSVNGIPSSIPEPATMSLLGVGVLALIRRKK